MERRDVPDRARGVQVRDLAPIVGLRAAANEGVPHVPDLQRARAAVGDAPHVEGRVDVRADVVHHRPVRELERQRVQVVAVAVRVGPAGGGLPGGAHRSLPRDPQAGVDRVNARIDVVAAAERLVVDPDEVPEPRLRGRAFRRVAESAGQVAGRDHADAVDGARVRPRHGLAVVRVRGNLVVDHEAALVRGRSRAQGLDLERPRHIDRHGLRHVDVQPRLHGRAGVLGEAVRRRLERDRVDAARNDALVARKPREAPRLVDLARVAAGVGDFLEVVRDRVKLIAAVLREEVRDPAPAPAAADDAELDARIGLRAGDEPRLEKGHAGERAAGRKELPPRDHGVLLSRAAPSMCLRAARPPVPRGRNDSVSVRG